MNSSNFNKLKANTVENSTSKTVLIMENVLVRETIIILKEKPKRKRKINPYSLNLYK